MSIQILASVMNSKSIDTIVSTMNIKSEAIIINQSDRHHYAETRLENGNLVKLYTFNERGVGLSRNSALMRSTSKYAVFADEDETFNDNYEELIEDAFDSNPKADMIIFNVGSLNSERPMHSIERVSRVRLYNGLKYGAVRFAIRVDSVRSKNVFFNLLFGGGAKYGSGEDTLFIGECIKNGLKVYTHPAQIGVVAQESSTWFSGYTDKFFRDKGALFQALSPKLRNILILQFALRKRRVIGEGRSILQLLSLMHDGAIKFSNRETS